MSSLRPSVPDTLPKDSSTGKTVEPAPWYWPASVPEALSVMDYGPDGQRPEKSPPARNADLGAPGDEVVSVGPEGDGHYFGSGSSLAAAHARGRRRAGTRPAPGDDGTGGRPPAHGGRVPGRPAPPRSVRGAHDAADGKRGRPPEEAAAHVPAAAPSGPLNRSLIVAAAGGALVLLVAGGAVIIPRGRARGWRPAGAPDPAAAPTAEGAPDAPDAPDAGASAAVGEGVPPAGGR